MTDKGGIAGRRALICDVFVVMLALTLLSACSGYGPAVAPRGGSSGPLDHDVQQAYDSFVRIHMPDLPVEVLQAAKAEGTVVWYRGQTRSDEDAVKKFREVFPFINLEGIKLSGGNLVQRFFTEYRAGQRLADVVTVTSLPDVLIAHREGFLMNYTLTVKDPFPEGHYVPGYAYPLYVTTMGVVWNPQRVKDEEAKVLLKWEGLKDARWDGRKIGIVDISAGGTYDALYTMQYKVFGTDLWEALARRSYTLFPGLEPATDAVVSGEIDLAVGLATSAANLRWQDGAPVRWYNPEPIVAVPVVQFIPIAPPHPNAARLFHEFMFTLPVQEFYVNTGYFSFRSGVQDRRKVLGEPWYVGPDAAKFWPYNVEEINTVRSEVRAKWNGIFKR